MLYHKLSEKRKKTTKPLVSEIFKKSPDKHKEERPADMESSSSADAISFYNFDIEEPPPRSATDIMMMGRKSERNKIQ
jgi:hypothetical protein